MDIIMKLEKLYQKSYQLGIINFLYKIVLFLNQKKEP